MVLVCIYPLPLCWQQFELPFTKVNCIWKYSNQDSWSLVNSFVFHKWLWSDGPNVVLCSSIWLFVLFIVECWCAHAPACVLSYFQIIEFNLLGRTFWEFFPIFKVILLLIHVYNIQRSDQTGFFQKFVLSAYNPLSLPAKFPIFPITSNTWLIYSIVIRFLIYLSHVSHPSPTFLLISGL